MQGGGRDKAGWAPVELMVALGVIAMMIVPSLPGLPGVRRSIMDMEVKMRSTGAARVEAALMPELGGSTDGPTWLEAVMLEFDVGGSTARSVHVVLGHTDPGDRGRVLLYSQPVTGDWFGLQLVLDGSETGRHACKGDLEEMTPAGCIGLEW